MAQRVDIWAAEEIYKIKAGHDEIKLICAVPFYGVELNRTPEQRFLTERMAKRNILLITQERRIVHLNLFR